MYINIVLFEKTCADTKPFYPYRFRDFANLIIPDFMAKLFKRPTVIKHIYSSGLNVFQVLPPLKFA